MKKHLKRLRAPRAWKLARKEFTWAYKPRPGPHPADRSLPLAMVLREMLRVADTAREAEHVIFARSVLVDGRAVTDPKFPVGFMDVVTLVPTKEHHRVLLDRRGRLALVPIDEASARWKLCRVEGKSTVPGGRSQVHLHDGRNLLLAKDEYTTGTTLKLSIPAQEIAGALPLEEGSVALLTGGQHAGELAHVGKIERTRNPRANVVYFREGFSTVLNYVFIVGTDTPEIQIPEGQAV